MDITVVILVLVLICLGLAVISGLLRRGRRGPAARAGVGQGSTLGADVIEAGGDQPVSGSVHSHHRHAPQPETSLPSHSSGSHQSTHSTHQSSHTGGHFGGGAGGDFGGHSGGHFGGGAGGDFGGHSGGHHGF